MRYLDQFYYNLSGPENGSKWVFLHGLMGYANNWRTIIRAFESNARCLAYDQRGHGKSIKPQSGYAPEDYAHDLLLILDDLQWDKITLVGHSMGGRNAIHFAFKYPERVNKLVIEDIGPEGDPYALRYYQALFDLIPTPFSDRRTAKDFLMTEFVKKAHTRDNAQMIAEYFYANMTELENEWGAIVVDWRFSKEAILESVAQGRAQDRWHEVQSLQVPTLLIRGELSKELSTETFQKMLACNEKIQGAEILGAGHWVHYDKSKEFIETIKKFI